MKDFVYGASVNDWVYLNVMFYFIAIKSISHHDTVILINQHMYLTHHILIQIKSPAIFVDIGFLAKVLLLLLVWLESIISTE